MDRAAVGYAAGECRYAVGRKWHRRQAESLPALLMPPPNVRVFSTAMAFWVAPLATILLLLSTLIPPTTVPMSRMPPPLKERAAHDRGCRQRPMVPVLVTPLLKVVWLITIAAVLPLKTVGYGPVECHRRPPKALCCHRDAACRSRSPGLCRVVA